MRATVRALVFATLAGLLLVGAGGAYASDCAGDCDGDGALAINDVIRGVNIALGVTPIEDCRALDVDGGGTIGINELILAVNAILASRCLDTPAGTETPSPPATPSATAPDGTTPTAPVTTEVPTAKPTVTNTASPSRSATRTATPTRTASPSRTPTATRIPPGRVNGVCRRTGSGPNGLRNCLAGVEVRIYSCDDRRTCLAPDGARSLLGTTTTSDSGTFEIDVPANPTDVPLRIGETQLADTTFHVMDFGSLGSPAEARAARAVARELTIDPISEAAVSLFKNIGLENFPDESLPEIDAAVRDANANTAFEGLDDRGAADLALQVANQAPQVQLLIEQNRSGQLCQDTHWRKDFSPFVVVQTLSVGGAACGDLAQPVRLTIDPGVEVRFRAQQGTFGIEVHGVLDARGTAVAPIVFTSDGAAMRGDWSGIHFAPDAVAASLDATGEAIDGCVLQNARLENAAEGTRGAVLIEGTAPLLSDLELRNNGGTGAIVVDGAPAQTMRRLMLRDNIGAGIVVRNGAGDGVSQLTDVSVLGGNLTQKGIAIEAARLRIDAAEISDMLTAVDVRSGGAADLRGALLRNNGTGVRVATGDLSISGGRFERNIARGVSLQTPGMVSIDGAVIACNGSTISGTATISGVGSIEYGGLIGSAGTCQVQHTCFASNANDTTYRAGASVESCAFQLNTFVGNSLFLSAVPPQMNNLLGAPFVLIAPQATGTLSAGDNWWGTTDAELVGSRIVDATDDPTRAAVTFAPLAAAPIAGAPDIDACAAVAACAP